jgi:hypothetical protein
VSAAVIAPAAGLTPRTQRSGRAAAGAGVLRAGAADHAGGRRPGREAATLNNLGGHHLRELAARVTGLHGADLRTPCQADFAGFWLLKMVFMVSAPRVITGSGQAAQGDCRTSEGF